MAGYIIDLRKIEEQKEQPKFLTVKQVAKLLGVTPLTIRNWDKAGKLKAIRHPINNYRLYKLEDIEKFLEKIKPEKEIQLG